MIVTNYSILNICVSQAAVPGADAAAKTAALSGAGSATLGDDISDEVRAVEMATKAGAAALITCLEGAL